MQREQPPLARARGLDDATVGRHRAYVAEHTNELDHRRFATHDPMFSSALEEYGRYQPLSAEIVVPPLRDSNAVQHAPINPKQVIPAS
jgi:hypothetical protein